MTVAGNGVKPSRFGWFQWDHQWGSAVQEGKMAPAQREPLQLLHHQISSSKYNRAGGEENDAGDGDGNDDDVLEMVCRSVSIALVSLVLDVYYKCDDGRFLVVPSTLVKFQLANFSKPRSGTAHLDFSNYRIKYYQCLHA